MKYVTNAIGCQWAYLSLKNHHRFWNGRAGVMFTVSGQLTCFAPIISRLLAKGYGEFTNKKTIDAATEKIKSSPQNPVPYIDRSDAYLHVWMSKLALRVAQQKIEAAEKNGDQALLFNSLIELGDVYREKRNYYFAEAGYKRAQDVSEKLEGNTFSTGKAIARQALVDIERGKKREAEELLNKSLGMALKAGKTQTDPDAGSVLRDYAKLLYKENRYEDVKKMYARFKTI